MAAHLGLPVMPWQRYVADVALEVNPDTGWWAYDEIVLTVPRRAGKSALMHAVFAHRLGSKRCKAWMTAQNGEKALDRWNDVWASFEPLVPAVRQYTTVGRERIVWKRTGSELVPFAPNGDNLHGEEIALLSVDELWKFDAAQALNMKGGYRPAFLTTDAQAWLISTAGTPESAWLNQARRDGRAAVESDARAGTAYFDWSLPDQVDGVDVEELGDEQLIGECIKIHPAVGFHPRVPAQKLRAGIAGDLAALGRVEFTRAYGNRTQGSTGGWSQVSEAAWTAALSKHAIPPGVPVAFGVEVGAEGRDAAVVAVHRGDDGRTVGEVIKYAEGSDWLPGTVAKLVERWKPTQVGINNAGASRYAADRLETLEVDVGRISGPDYAAACDAVKAQLSTTPRPGLCHIGQAELTESVKHAGRKSAGRAGAWQWVPTGDVSITPLVGLTAAVWALDHPGDAEEDPGPFWMR